MCGVLGFELITTLRRPGGVHLRRRVSSPHRAEYLGEPRRIATARRHDGPVSTSPSSTRRAPNWPTRCVGSKAAGIPLDGASDHGVSEALYLRDPDQNGVELYWDRPEAEWPRDAEGRIAMMTKRLDLNSLRAERG